MNSTEGIYMEETEEGRQSSDYTGNKDDGLQKKKKWLLNWLWRETSATAKEGKKRYKLEKTKGYIQHKQKGRDGIPKNVVEGVKKRRQFEKVEWSGMKQCFVLIWRFFLSNIRHRGLLDHHRASHSGGVCQTVLLGQQLGGNYSFALHHFQSFSLPWNKCLSPQRPPLQCPEAHRKSVCTKVLCWLAVSRQKYEHPWTQCTTYSSLGGLTLKRISHSDSDRTATRELLHANDLVSSLSIS